MRCGSAARDAGRNSIRPVPPLVVSAKQVDERIEILEDGRKAAEARKAP